MKWENMTDRKLLILAGVNGDSEPEATTELKPHASVEIHEHYDRIAINDDIREQTALEKLRALRKKAYELPGSYEDSYILLMESIDEIISGPLGANEYEELPNVRYDKHKLKDVRVG